MNKHSDVLGLAANILIAVVILLIIIVSLNKMGLYKLPSPIEKLLSTSDEDEIPASVDDEKLYGSLDYDKNEDTDMEKVSVTYQNARTMLDSVENDKNYHHEISVTHKNDKKTVSKKVVLEKRDGLYTADIYSASGNHLKRISESNTDITVTEYKNADSKSYTYPKGSFTVPDLSSVVVDFDSFLSGGYELEEAEFSVIQGDFGIKLEIMFETVMEGYVQQEVYSINPDYGVVTEAQCYENGVMVYDMQTLVLREMD